MPKRRRVDAVGWFRHQNFFKTLTEFILTSSLKWMVEHWRRVPISLWGFQVTESALNEREEIKTIN